MIVNIGRSANAWFIRNDIPKVDIDSYTKEFVDNDGHVTYYSYEFGEFIVHMKNVNGYTGMNRDYVLDYTETYIKKATKAVNKAYGN